jgi:hypothetical protein
MSEKAILKDGIYPCSATLHVREGKAIAVLHSMFGLVQGTTISLYRKEHNLVIEPGDAGKIGILNGHAII